MRLHLWWFDKNWQQRGYAKYLHLSIYFNEKKYKLIEDMFYGYDGREYIEVKRKSDITDYVKELKANGYTEKDTKTESENTELAVAKRLWSKLSDVIVDENDCIIDDWYAFPKGTCKIDIWHWFEDVFGISVAEDLMETAN